MLVPFVHWSYGPGNHTQGPFQGVHSSSDFKRKKPWHNTGLSSNHESARIQLYEESRQVIKSVGKLTYKRVQPHKSMESIGISLSMFSLRVLSFLALSTRLSPEKVFCTVTYSVLLSQTPLPCLVWSHTKCLWHVSLHPTGLPAMYDHSVNQNVPYTNVYSILALYLTPRNSHSSYGPGNHMQGPFSTRRAPVSVSSTDTYSSEKTLRL